MFSSHPQHKYVVPLEEGSHSGVQGTRRLHKQYIPGAQGRREVEADTEPEIIERIRGIRTFQDGRHSLCERSCTMVGSSGERIESLTGFSSTSQNLRGMLSPEIREVWYVVVSQARPTSARLGMW